jgi:hypothetical protein
VKDVMVKPVYKDEFAPPGAKFAVKATFDDNPANQDNYVFRLYKNGKELTDSLFKVGITDDRMWNGSKIDTTEIFFIMFNYKLGRGTSVVVATDSVRTNDTIILETEGTTFGYRSFVENMQLQYAGSSPIGGGPPANVATNINPKDKAVGYFATYTVSRDTVIMK